MALYNYSELSEPVRNYLIYMETIKGKSPRTVYEYFLDLRTFFRYIKKLKGLVPSELEFNKINVNDVDIRLIESITLSDVYSFLDYTLNQRGNAAAARSRKISCLRSFFKYLTKKVFLLKDNPVAELDSPKAKKSLPKYMVIDEAIALLKAVDGKNKQRDFAIITIFLNCGIRLSELVGINITNIKNSYLTVLGKGNKERTVYLNEACLYAIEEYMKVRKKPKDSDRNALFLSNRGTRISHENVQYLVKKYIQKAGLDTEKYSVHKLRHTAATLMYQNGVDVRVLQEILGHTSLATTQIYTHLSGTELQDAANKNPLSKVKIKNEEK